MDVIFVCFIKFWFIGGQYVWYDWCLFVVGLWVGGDVLWAFVYIEEMFDFMFGVMFVVEFGCLKVLLGKYVQLYFGSVFWENSIG